MPQNRKRRDSVTGDEKKVGQGFLICLITIGVTAWIFAEAFHWAFD